MAKKPRVYRAEKRNEFVPKTPPKKGMRRRLNKNFIGIEPTRTASIESGPPSRAAWYGVSNRSKSR
jgi:hypothetical protein